MSSRGTRALIFAAVFLGFISACGTRATLPLPAGSGNERDILFDSWAGGRQEIWIIKPDGSGLRPLTRSPKGSHNMMPDWSPDGLKVVFASTRHAPLPDLAPASPRGLEAEDIYVINPDGSAWLRLTFNGEPNDSPDWSPDGKRIAFVSSRDGRPKVYLMDADGSHLQRLTSDRVTPKDKSETQPAWSPDGSRIVFSSDHDGDFEIYVFELKTSTLTHLTHNEVGDARPAWSPDGRHIAFDSTRDGNWEIYVMRADGSHPARLTSHPRMDTAPAWSRDGQRIAFNSTRDGLTGDLADCEIYVMNRDGSDVRRLTLNTAKDTHPDW